MEELVIYMHTLGMCVGITDDTCLSKKELREELMTYPSQPAFLVQFKILTTEQPPIFLL